MDQIVRFGGNGVGQILAAAAVALLIRLFSDLHPEGDTQDYEYDREDVAEDVDDNEEAPMAGKICPVTIRWENLTCSVSDKSSKSVEF